MTAKLIWWQKSRLRSWWEKIRSGLRWLWQKIKQHLFITTGIIIVLLIAFILAAYTLGWDWTGFTSVTGPQLHPNEQYRPAKTLWDWLQLLIIPAAIAFGGLWFTRTQRKAEQDIEARLKVKEKEQEEKAEKKILLRKYYSNIIQAYNAAKGVRRLLRATAQCLSPDQKELWIMIEPYDKQMQTLIEIQLQFETFKDEVESNPTLFSGNVDLAELKRNLSIIEKYLNHIVDEYEDLYKKRPNATPTLPISTLLRLEGFIGEYSRKNEFLKSAHQVREALRNLLASE